MKQVPYTVCKPVCYEKTINCMQWVCKQVPYTVTRCVPRVVCKQVPVQVCCPVPCCPKSCCQAAPSCEAPKACAGGLRELRRGNDCVPLRDG